MLFVSRKAEVQCALSSVELLLETWLDEGLEEQKSGKSIYDLRAQYMLPDLYELKRKNENIKL